MAKRNRKSSVKGGEQRAKQNQKRWFVSAAGWGFALTLGSGTQQSTGSKAKRSVSLPASTKQISYNFGSNFTHNTVYWFNALSGITQGTTSASRIGDRVKIENLSVSVLCNLGGNSNPAVSTTFRVLLVGSSSQFATSTLGTGSLTSAYLFMGNTSPDLSVCATDPHLCHVLCDETITLDPMVTSAQPQRLMSLDCMADAWYEYQIGTNVGVAANLYWVFIGDQFAGTAGTTVVGNITGQARVLFNDE